MKIETVTSAAGAAALGGEWDALARLDRRDGFFRTSGWYQAWMTHIRPRAKPFIVVARADDGRVAGIAPLCTLTYSDLGFRHDALAWGGREVVSGDFLGIVAEPDRRSQVTAAIVDYLFRMRSEWSLLVMGELVTGGEGDQAIGEAARSYGLPVRRQEPRVCPYIALPARFDEYLNSLSSSMRYHIRRRQRDILDKNKAVIERHTDPATVASQIDLLTRLHQKRWAKDGQPGTLGRPGFGQFLTEVCGHPPGGGSACLYLLRHEGEPVSAILMFYFGASAIYYQAGWDPASRLAALSPAVVLMARSIQDAIEDGYSYYEFLRGDESYKARWTGLSRETSTLLVASSGTAKAYLAAARLKDGIKQKLAAPAGATRSGVAAR